ncbi:hypothetical protein ACQHIV_42215 (plasmid) [Kribbella sp. GL6]|uniref:hypothetical protein n=1 Tax=Kribbella sp. GL6 TaxID=3419765 RepID=UPI003CFE9071
MKGHQLDLFEQVAAAEVHASAAGPAEPMVTIHVSIRAKRQEPRATYRFPAGQHDLERWDTVDPAAAQHYNVQLIPGGPFMSSVQACQNGVHTDCRSGNHDGCPFRPGRTHEHGLAIGAEFLERRDEHGHWRVVCDEYDRAIQLLPRHVWFCACECHVDLFADESGR